MNAIGFFHSKKRNTLPVFPRTSGVCAYPFTATEYAANQALQFNLTKRVGFTDYRFDVTFDANHVVTDTVKFQEIITKSIQFGVKLYPVILNGYDFNLSEFTNYSNGFTRGQSFFNSWGANFTHVEIGSKIDNALLLTGDGSLFSHYDAVKYGKAREWIRGVANGLGNIKTITSAENKHWGYMSQLIADGVRINITGWRWYSEMETGFASQIAQSLIAKYTNKDIWFTEVNSRSQDDNVQSSFVSSFYTYLSGFTRVSKLFINELFDQPNNANTADRNYGMYVYNGDQTATAKPLANYFINIISGKSYPPQTQFLNDTPTALPRPGLLQSVIENSFGVIADGFNIEIKRVTEDNITHHYSKTQAWNCDMTKVVFGGYVHDANYNRLYPISGLSSNFQWSHTEPNKMITMDNEVMYQRVLTNTGVSQTTIVNFRVAPYLWTDANFGPVEGSFDLTDTYIGMSIIDSDGVKKLVTFNVKTKTIIAKKPLGFFLPSGGVLDFIDVSPSANYVLVRTKGFTSGGIEHGIYDINLNFLFAAQTGSHADFCYDQDGYESLVSLLPFRWMRLATQQTFNFPYAGLLATYNGTSGGHCSGANYLRNGWVYVSLSNGLRRCFAAKLDLSGIVENICFTRDTLDGYTNETQMTVSPDGRITLVKSGFNGSPVSTYAVEVKRSI